MSKTIHVAVAVICDAQRSRVFATARGYGDQKGQWEFPGGKLEPGETAPQALVREIREELNTEIRVEDFLDRVEYDYPGFHLTMDCYWCQVLRGELTLLEAQEGRWLSRSQLHDVPWLPADRVLIEKIEIQMTDACKYCEETVG